MPNLAEYLTSLRGAKQRSRRWVERKSRELYPDESKRHVSHTFLRQLELGLSDRPARLKLATLAEIYEVDPANLFVAADYAVEKEANEGNADTSMDGLTLEREFRAWLEKRGVRPEYFYKSVMGLSDESFHLFNRFISNLSVRESKLRTTGVPKNPAKKGG